MSSRIHLPQAPDRRRRRLVLLAVLALFGLTAPALAASLPIDPWPHYQPQTTCSPTPKQGTLMLASWLQATYKGSGSLGISRECGSGGTSEHKEGRAFDWALDARSARDRGYAAAFLQRLRDTDRAGNADALARRMGIMYVIWDDHIYSATYHYAERPYLNAGCSKVATCSTTLRHRDHMHISLTWAGALAQTSWYQARLHPGAGGDTSGGHATPTPTPTPTPEPTPSSEPTHPSSSGTGHGPELDVAAGRVTTLQVAGNGAATTTRSVLRKGHAYKLTVFGVYRYGPGSQDVTDASCVWSPNRKAFVPNPTAAVRSAYGSLNLLVNNHKMTDTGCDPRRHTYRVKYVPTKDTNLQLRVAASGTDTTATPLTVLVSAWKTPVRQLVPRPVRTAAAPPVRQLDAVGTSTVEDEVRLDAVSSGTSTGQVLTAGVRYRVTVSGVVSLGGGVYSDGQCLYSDGAWTQQMSLDLNAPDADHGNVFVNGHPFAGTAPGGDTSGCGAHSHAMVYIPAQTERAWFSLWDPFTRTDNQGDLNITVERLDKITVPAAAPARTGSGRPWYTRYENTSVAAADPNGTTSTMMFKKGEHVRLYVSGTYTDGGRISDAACVTRGAARTDAVSANGQWVGRLYVDGVPGTWRPWHGSGCDAGSEYVGDFTTVKPGPISLAVLDLDYTDNVGDLDVLITRD